jgi:pimeloyl-ACP methyl ester carboxylesterase
MAQSRVIEGRGVALEVLVEGEGPLVVMLASLGRPAQDFDDLALRLAKAGYTAVRPQPRGIGRSRGPMTGLSLADLAGDVALVMESLGGGPSVVIGHAFGQRVARMLATQRPDLVKGLVMLAAGGKVPIPERARAALHGCFDQTLSGDRHLEHVAYAFFAPGNDAAVWREGWHADVARMQSAAVQGLAPEGGAGTSVGAWWAGGSARMLVVQGLQDAVALPQNGRLLQSEYSDRVELVEIDGAGHALLPEQPDAIAAAVLRFLARL